MAETAGSSGTDIPMIDGVEGLTAAWVSAAMSRHTGGARVASLERTPVGTGQVADTVRLEVTWEPDGAGPASLIAKVTAADETSRAAAAMTRTYEIEHAFYRDLADSLQVRSPHCYHCDHDAPGNRYVLVLEDLAPARQGDQIAGCTPDEAALAVDELVRLHAPRWGDPALRDLPWLNRHDPDAGDSSGFFQTLADGFLERYADTLEPEIADLVRRFAPRVAVYGAQRAEPHTVVHSDYRLDNLLFGGDRVGVVDWQTVTLGPAVADLSYFLGASLRTEDRRTHERDLVARYVEALSAAGIEDLDLDGAWEQYRVHSFAGLLMAVAASMLVTRTERGDEMFMVMAHRHGRHALDLDAEKVLG
jgi:hypothetical protein